MSNPRQPILIKPARAGFKWMQVLAASQCFKTA
jgi:hypothetical protein